MFLLNHLYLRVFLGKLLFESSTLLSQLFGKLLLKLVLETFYMQFELLFSAYVPTNISL